MDSASSSDKKNNCPILNENAFVCHQANINISHDDDGNSSNDDLPISPTKLMRQRKRSSLSNSQCKINKSNDKSNDDTNNVDSGESNTSGNNLRKQILIRRSPSPLPGSAHAGRENMHVRRQISRLISVGLSSGYAQYQKALLEVPMPRDYGEASSDDLSSEWDSDVPETQHLSNKVNSWIYYKFSNL